MHRSLILLALLPVAHLAAADSLTLEQDIRPILKEHCFDCHGAAKEMKGGLDLRQRQKPRVLESIEELRYYRAHLFADGVPPTA